MDVVYGLIPFVLAFGFLAVVVFIWMAKKGQFDDLDGAANRILFEEDEEPSNGSAQAERSSTDEQPERASSSADKR